MNQSVLAYWMFIFTGINIKDPKPKKKLTGRGADEGERKCLTMAKTKT